MAAVPAPAGVATRRSLLGSEKPCSQFGGLADRRLRHCCIPGKSVSKKSHGRHVAVGSPNSLLPKRSISSSSRSRSLSVCASTQAAGVTETGQFSLGDDVLESRGLLLSGDHRDIDLDDLNILFSKVGFPTREKAKLSVALAHTMDLIAVRETKTGKLVSFARATGDWVFNAIIWDVVVDPRYQGTGLGKAVMERLLSSLLRRGIVNIALYAEPNVVGFYRPLGFVTDPSGIRGMAFDRRRRP